MQPVPLPSLEQVADDDDEAMLQATGSRRVQFYGGMKTALFALAAAMIVGEVGVLLRGFHGASRLQACLGRMHF